ncbi:MAG: aminotransferase class IV family protein [Actinobacteria bacterium]|nr:aminotransferase class IV family protein [Actinomycetota bacterium]
MGLGPGPGVGRNRAQDGSPDRTRIWEGGTVSEQAQGESSQTAAVRAWVNGELVGPTAPSIAAVDHGITVGDGVFETCKVIDGVPFALQRHARRLDRSLAGLGLHPADHDVLDIGIKAVLAGEPIAYGRLRYTVTGGAGPLGSDRDSSPLTYIVTASSTSPNPDTAKLVVVPWTRNERSATAGLKTTSYAENVVALAYAKERGGVEAVFANSVGDLCEGTGSNIFVVVDGEILTPDLGSGPLAGITRQLVIEWCREEGLTVRAEPLAMSILTKAQEVFITSSIKDVMAVHSIDDRPVATPGPVTAQVAEIFARLSRERRDP